LCQSQANLQFSLYLDDLDELAGFVAAEANHAKDKKITEGVWTSSATAFKLLWTATTDEDN